jgi:beta-glucanase (GH16 family)
MFTWLCGEVSCSTSSSSVQEADIEILTRGPQNKIQLTNQPSESPSGDTLSQATLNATLPDGIEWTAWNEYRYDWLPGSSSWYVNGASVGRISFQAPRDPSGIILNMWSNGGSWTGNMSTGGASYLQIQWIEIVYNTSGPASGSTKLVSDELDLLRRSSILAGSRVGDQFGQVRDLFSSPDMPHGHGLVSPRSDSSSCHTVCSIDTNVTTIGTPVVLSIARRENGRHATVTLILLVLISIWFSW